MFITAELSDLDVLMGVLCFQSLWIQQRIWRISRTMELDFMSRRDSPKRVTHAVQLKPIESVGPYGAKRRA